MMDKKLIIPLSMMVTGALILLLSYIYTSLILTFIGLGLTFWGAIIYYVTSSYHIPAKILDVISTSFTNSIADLISRLGYDSNIIFFYSTHLKDINQGYIFIPTNDNVDINNKYELKYVDNLDDSKGLIIKAPSQDMIELFEDKLGANLRMFSLDALGENLAKVIVEDLKLADAFNMSVEDSIVNVKISGKEIANMCSKINSINASLCPICSSIALAISKSSGKMVTINKSVIKARSIENTYTLIGA